MKALKAVIDSVWAEAAMLVAVLANTLILIALTGPGWGKPRDATPDASPNLATLGLWKTCAPVDQNGETHCRGYGPDDNLPGWFTAVQALITTSTVGLMGAFGVMFVFACIKSVKEDRRLLLVYILTTLIFAVIGLAGVVLFGERLSELRVEKVQLTTAWSWILAATGVGIHFLCITLVIVELILGSRRQTTSSDTAAVIADAAEMATSSGPTIAMETVA